MLPRVLHLAEVALPEGAPDLIPPQQRRPRALRLRLALHHSQHGTGAPPARPTDDEADGRRREQARPMPRSARRRVSSVPTAAAGSDTLLSLCKPPLELRAEKQRMRPGEVEREDGKGRGYL